HRAGDPAGDRCDPAVGPLVDPDRIGERCRDDQADDVPADGGQGAVVEHRTGPAEDAAVEQLGRAAGPVELVAAVAPPVPDDEHGERDVRNDDPQQELAGAHRLASVVGITSGGANGSRPTSSWGGPLAASLTVRAPSAPEGAPTARQTASST